MLKTNKIFINQITKPHLRKSYFNNVRGMAIIEILPIILVMFVLMGAALGSWGLVHTAILNSIASRHNSFFYFNNRSDLSYLRDFGSSYRGLSFIDSFYRDQKNRFAYITSENALQDAGTKATLRFVDFKNPGATCKDQGSKCLQGSKHNEIYNEVLPQRTDKLVSPAWIMVGYGICLNADCR